MSLTRNATTEALRNLSLAFLCPLVATPASAQIVAEYISVTGEPAGGTGCFGAPARCEGSWVVGELGQIDFDVYLPNPTYGPTDSVCFVLSWPDEWTVLHFELCGAVPVTGIPLVNGGLLKFALDCSATTDQPFLTVRMNCSTPGTLELGDGADGEIRAYSCERERWESQWGRRRVEVLDCAAPDAHADPCDPHCESSLAVEFALPFYQATVAQGGRLVDTLSVHGSTRTRLCGGGICGGPLEYAGQCLAELASDREWLSARLLPGRSEYDHRFELAVNGALLTPGLHSGRLRAHSTCGDCFGGCFRVDLAVEEVVAVPAPVIDVPAALVGFEVIPNPSTSHIRVAVDVTRPSPITVSVFDVEGRLVTTLARERHVSAGRSLLAWNASAVPPGVYFVSVSGGSSYASRRVVLF